MFYVVCTYIVVCLSLLVIIPCSQDYEEPKKSLPKTQEKEDDEMIEEILKEKNVPIMLELPQQTKGMDRT